MVAVLTLSSSLVSCDLETAPSNAVVDTEVFKTTAGNEKVLIGSWGYLLESFSSYANPGYGAFLRTSDAMGSDVVVSPSYGFANQYGFNSLYQRSGTNSFSWNITYKTINSANNVIARIGESQGSIQDKQRVLGQAYALRGFMYLHLASSYGFAVDLDPQMLIAPIYTEPTHANTVGNAASSVSQVYKQAIGDLEQALELIPENYQRDYKYKFDQSVVLGLLSRANLYARNWDKAVFYSDQILNGDKYSVLMNEAQYKSGFNDVNNIEWIWGHPQTPEQNNASYQFNFLDVTSQQSFYFSFNMDPYFYEKFDESDYRRSMMFWAPNPGVSNPQDRDIAYFRYNKFRFRASQVADIVLMRSSEIYLINAEAKAHLGHSDAIDVLNTLKQARGAKLVHGSFGEELLEQIWLERRKELFGEGFSLVDIVRNQKAVQRKDYPQDSLIAYTYEVMDSNNNMKQVTVNLLPQGHRVLNFPDKSSFVPNSKYYLYRIPEVEELENKNLFPGLSKAF